MATEILNDAEKFLLNQWAESRLLEASMEGVRTKYKELFQRVIEAVTEAHPELDTYAVYVTQMWSKGSLGFGRKAWPAENRDWPPGFWIDQVRLEKLAADDTSPPSATIWIPIKTAKKAGVELADARAEVIAAAQQMLTKDEFDQCGKNDADRQVMLSFPTPSKRELLELFADGDGQRFVARLLSQFDLLARFVPVLDKVLLKQSAPKQEKE